MIERHSRRRLAALTLLASLPACIGHADRPAERVRGPLPTRILQPAALVFPRPTARRAATLDPGRSRVTLDVAYASIFEVRRRGGTAAEFDGEIGRTAVRLAHGLADGSELVVAPTFLFASSGFLDRIVDEFHDLSGFAGGGRDLAPRDQYSMRLERGGVVAWELEEDQLRLADLPITWVRPLRAEDTNGPAVSTRLTVELPTGSEGRGTGSGGIDYAAGVLLERTLERWTITGGIDGVFADTPDDFSRAGVDVRDLFFASGGVEYRWNDHLSLLFEAQLQMPLTRSITFEEIDREILDLGFGAAFDVAPGAVMTLSFHEDAVAASGPDLTVYAGLAVLF